MNDGYKIKILAELVKQSLRSLIIYDIFLDIENN